MREENEKEFENIKAMWLELSTRISALEEANRRLSREITANTIKTARERLVSKYRAFTIVACIMIVYICLTVAYMPYTVEKYRIPTLIYCCIFFLFEVCIDLYLMINIKKIDIYHSTAIDIARQTARNWRIHKSAIIIGIPMAMGAIILFYLLLNANNYVIGGMLAGGVSGLILAVGQLRKFLQYYRLMQ